MRTANEIEPGLWTMDVHLDEYDVRGALIAGEKRAVVWDTLSHPRDMDGWRPLIGDRELVIVYSHADWDHIWGTAGLPHAGTPILAHEGCRERFHSDVPLTLAEKRTNEPGAWDEVVLVPPTRVLSQEEAIDLGGMTLVLRPLPGHTPDSIVGFLPERGVLLAGDTIETPCPVIPLDSPLAEWIGELERWEQDERLRLVIPAHGRIGGRDLLRQNIAYLRGILDGRPVSPEDGESPPGVLSDFYRETHRTNLQWTERS